MFLAPQKTDILKKPVSSSHTTWLQSQLHRAEARLGKTQIPSHRIKRKYLLYIHTHTQNLTNECFHRLYVRGFSDKLQKEEVRRVLYMLFNTYGPVMDINIMKTVKMHGQAHIVMKDIQTATHAMRQTDGIEFLGGTLVSGSSPLFVSSHKFNMVNRVSSMPKARATSSPRSMVPTKVRLLLQRSPPPLLLQSPLPSSAHSKPPSSISLPGRLLPSQRSLQLAEKLLLPTRPLRLEAPRGQRRVNPREHGQ